MPHDGRPERFARRRKEVTELPLADIAWPFYHRLFAIAEDSTLPPVLYSLLFLLGPGLTGAQAGNVVSGMPTIIDGDSLAVSGERFQLHGIDAPEPGELCEKANGKRFDCGRIARSALLDLTAGVEVICQTVDSAFATTQSAKCTAGGFSLSRNMIHTGWALVDRSVTDDFVEVEAEAKRQERGLWRFVFKVPPWPESFK